MKRTKIVIIAAVILLAVALALGAHLRPEIQVEYEDTVPSNGEIMDKNGIFAYVTQNQKQLELLIGLLEKYEGDVSFRMKDGELTVYSDNGEVTEAILLDRELMAAAGGLLKDHPVEEISKTMFQTSEEYIYTVWFPLLEDGARPNVVYSEDDQHEGEAIIGKWKYKENYGV